MTDTVKTVDFVASINARIAFERAKVDSQMSDANYKKLDKAARVVSVDSVVALMTESNVNADFANRSLVSNARMNVYTIEKISNALAFAVNAAKLNDYTLFILKTAIALKKAELSMTRTDAKDACSKHRKIADKSRAKHIVQNSEIKDDSTVNAQHASSLDALLTLNVLSKSFDAANNDVYTLTDSALAAKMIERLAA